MVCTLCSQVRSFLSSKQKKETPDTKRPVRNVLCESSSRSEKECDERSLLKDCVLRYVPFKLQNSKGITPRTLTQNTLSGARQMKHPFFGGEKANKQKTHKHFSDGACGTIVPSTNPHPSQRPYKSMTINKFAKPIPKLDLPPRIHTQKSSKIKQIWETWCVQVALALSTWNSLAVPYWSDMSWTSRTRLREVA